MKPSRVKEVLIDAFRNQEQILVVGEPGIGKSAIGKQVAKELNAKLLVSSPNIEDPTYQMGFPTLAKDNGHAVFAPFWNAHEALSTTQEPVLWILEDFGQASESVQKAYMHSLDANHRLVAGRKLPDNVVFVAFSNDVKQMSGVMGLLEPIKSRFNSIVFMESDLTDWTTWAIEADMPSHLVAFIRSNPKVLSQFKATRDFTNSPSPRNWEHVGRRWKRDLFDRELDEGSVGKGATVEAYAFLDLAKNAPSLDDILMHPSDATLPEKPSIKYLVAGGLARRLTQGNIEAAMKYLNRMEQPFRVLAMLDATRRDKQLCKTRSFITWAAKEGNDLI